MKIQKLALAALCAASLALCQSAHAVTVTGLDIRGGVDANFQDITGGGNQNVIIYEWLKGEVLSYNNHNDPNSADLPDPTSGLVKYDKDTPGGLPASVQVEADDYVVLHYGVGNGGVSGSGGGLVAIYFATAGTYTPPLNGSGPNGFGGLSFIDIFDHTGTTGGGPGGNVPDGGATALLLGVGAMSLALVRSRAK